MAEAHGTVRNGLPAWERGADRALADAADRARILTELDRNLVVEAAAGAGKTHALVGRIVALLAGGGCAIDEVAAVTFTRKAAGELRGRLLTRIEDALRVLGSRGDPDPEARRRLRAALDDFEQAFAGTIHSFCARLLRERPVEAGVDPGFEELDPREQGTLRREAWDRHLDLESEGPSERLARLEELGIDPEGLYSTFGTLAQFPEVEIPREPRPAPDLGPAVERVRRFVEWGLARVPDDPVEERYDGMQGTLFAARSFLRTRLPDLEAPATRAELLKLFDGGTRIVLKLWGDKDVGREVRERFGELEEETIAPALRAWREHCYAPVIEFLEPAARRYARLREERGVLDFQDLLLRTARLLREHPETRDHFRSRFPRILVDEFQDTDPVQAEILLLLTGAERGERDWRRLTPRPGGLFLVGDPKQSIYRFRRADVDVYRFVRDRIAATGGEVVSLRTSFRSRAPLVEWLNESLEPILEAHDREVQPPFVPLAPHRSGEGDRPARAAASGPAPRRPGDGSPRVHPGVRRLLHEKVYGNRLRDVAEIDAGRVARWIRAAVDAGPGERLPGPALVPGEVLVLLRQKRHLPLYARALEEEGLPYEVSGGDAASGSEELASLLTMAEAALRPDDPLALVAHLRGALAGISDDALYRFRRAGGVWDYGAYERRGRVLPEIEEAEAFGRIFRELDRAYTWLQSLPPATALGRLLSETGILAHAAGLEAGSSRAGSLYRVLSLARGWQRSGREVAWILEELRALAEGEGSEVEEMGLEVGRGEAVRVMNLHKAKGLQARVVFLADPLLKSNGRVERHIERVGEEEPRGHFRVTRRNRYGAPFDDLALPPGWEERERREERYLEAEEARLLYVAATRARDLLVVSHYPHAEKGPWTPFFDALEEVPELETPPAGDAPEDESPEKIRPEGRPEGDGAALAASGVAERAPALQRPDADRLGARRRALARPSYAIVQPSGEPAGEHPAGEGTDGATGPVPDVPVRGIPGEDPETALAMGRAVHELLRAMVEEGREPDAALVRRRLEAEGLGVGDSAERAPEGGAAADRTTAALAAAERVRDAWFWPELERAERVLCEVPFGRMRPGDADRPALERGVVDLAFRGRDGWVIVDYKTHRAEDAAVLDLLAERLGPQVVAYRAAWEAISGEPVRRAGLFFTAAGAWREIAGRE